MPNPDATTRWTSAAVAIATLMLVPVVGQAQVYRRATGRLRPEVPAAEPQRLTASDAESTDQFGWSVAANGDTLAICAIQAEDPDGGDPANAGAVVVFTQTGGVWSELQIIHNPAPGPNDYFGQTLALSDDHLFVGVPADTINDVSQAGSVYVYSRQGGLFQQQQHLFLDAPTESGRFGISLETDGERLFVGASRAGEDREGMVYVFGRDGLSWDQTQTLNASDWVSDNSFGAALALSGDWLVVGAPGDPNGSIWGAGAAYVFRLIGDSWVEHQKLRPADPDWYDVFGLPVAISGDTILVSAPGKDHPDNDDAGAVYVFNETSGNWTQGVQLFGPDPTYGTRWGQALALNGDTAFMGFPNTLHSDLPYDGAVDVLTRAGGVWSYLERLLSPQPVSSGSFGYSLAQSGSDLLIGAPMEDAPGPVWDAGAAYVMTVPGP